MVYYKPSTINNDDKEKLEQCRQLLQEIVGMLNRDDDGDDIIEYIDEQYADIFYELKTEG